MIKFKRNTEYALMSLLHISQETQRDPNAVSTAREISEKFGIPFEVTAKTLQKLKAQGLINSIQGAQGGYALAQPLNRVSLAWFLNIMEGESQVAGCLDDKNLDPQVHSDCQYSVKCGIKPFMSTLNSKLAGFFKDMTLAELER